MDQEWHTIGTKRSVSGAVSKCTGILESTVIDFTGTLGFGGMKSGIGEVMSWAAQRRTTRVEDQAYLLLGLLGVYMPAMYGEHHNAFTRLQVQLVESCEDDSIFAWQDTEGRHGPLLTKFPDYFSGYSSRPLQPGFLWDEDPRERRMTNRGLRLEPLLRWCNSIGKRECFLMPLNCTHPTDHSLKLCAAIYINEYEGKFSRCGNHRNRSGEWIPHAQVVRHSIDDREGFERKVIYACNF